MQISKRILACVLVVMMIASMGLATFAEDTTEPVNEVTGSAGETYKKAIDTVKALGFMIGYTSTDFGADNAITRAEFAAVMARVMNADLNAFATTPLEFTDVDPDFWAVKEIKAAVAMGLMVGDGAPAYTFRPDDTISAVEATKVVICALGYGPEAEQNGGYPWGYNVVGSRRGFTKNLIMSSDTGMNRGMVAQLVYNLLDIDIMKQTTSGYEPIDGETILTVYHNMEKATGTVNANQYSSLTDANGRVIKGHVRIATNSIGTQLFAAGETKAADYLGYAVDVYFSNDNDTRTIKYITYGKRVETLTIAAEDLISYDGSTYRYYNNNREVRIRVTPSTTLYNGVAGYTGDDDYIYLPLTGDVTLIDNTGAGYEIISISSYRTYLVQSASAATMTIKDKYAQTTLDLNDLENVIINYDGEEVDLSAIRPDAVLKVYADAVKPATDGINVIKVDGVTAAMIDEANMTYCKIDAMEEYVSGKIDGFDPSENTVSLDGTIFKVSPDYIVARLLNNANTLDYNKMNLNVKFFLDDIGLVAGMIEQNITGGNYGMLASMEKDGTSIETKLVAKIFTVNGVMELAPFADRIRFNGKSVDLASRGDMDAFIATKAFWVTTRELDLTADGKIQMIGNPAEIKRTVSPAASAPFKDYFRQQIVSYTLNDKGQISEFNTAVFAATSSINSLPGYVVNQNLDKTQSYLSLDARLRSDAQSSGGVIGFYRIAETKVIIAPATFDPLATIWNWDPATETYKQVVTPSNSGEYLYMALKDAEYSSASNYFASEASYATDLYNISRDYKAPIGVVAGSASPTVASNGSDFFFVEKVGKSIVDGEVKSTVFGYMGGSRLEIPVRDDKVANLAELGDAGQRVNSATYVGDPSRFPAVDEVDVMGTRAQWDAVNGAGISWIRNFALPAADLAKGDIIEYVTNPMGEMVNYRIVVSNTDIALPLNGAFNGREALNYNNTTTGGYWGDSQTIFAPVEFVVNDAVMMNGKFKRPEFSAYNADTDTINLTNIASMIPAFRKIVFLDDPDLKVFIYDVKSGRITPGAKSQVEEGDYVAVRVKFGKTKTMFIYKGKPSKEDLASGNYTRR